MARSIPISAGFQNLWETSRVQPGEAGIITDYLGSKPGLGDAKSALDAFRADLPKMSQKMADSVDPNAVTSWFWSVYPFTLGSYASAKTGQYTTLLDVVAEPALHGRLLLAGEHTMAESKAVTVPLRRSPRDWHSRTDFATATSNARSSKRVFKSSRNTTKESLASGAQRSPRLTFCRPLGMAQLVGRNSEDLWPICVAPGRST